MFPILLKLGPVTIRTYGLLVAVGFFVALQYLLRRAGRFSIPENRLLDLVLYVIVAGLVGARIAYVLFNWSFYSHRLFDVFKVWEGGLVFYGGFIAAVITVILYAARHKDLRLWTVGDLFAPALALGHAFGRLGCFFAGCCYGLPTHLPWGVQYCSTEALAPLGVSLHPTQLYEAAGNLAIFFALDLYNRRRHPEGYAFASYLMLYAALRFCVEFLRGDERGAFFAGLSPSQVGSLLVAVAAVTIFVWRKDKYVSTINS
jgi:phosphatidylglycerol:prolipoprotein diacylglycerol transferase